MQQECSIMVIGASTTKIFFKPIVPKWGFLLCDTIQPVGGIIFQTFFHFFPSAGLLARPQVPGDSALAGYKRGQLCNSHRRL